MVRKRPGKSSSSPNVKLRYSELLQKNPQLLRARGFFYGVNMDSAFIETLREGREGGTSLPGCRLILSDGSTYFILLADSDAFDCHSGMPVDPLFREELRRAHTRREICAKALDLTARRDHARQELKLKLEKRFIYSGGGDSGEVRILIDQVLLLLQQRGFLDDRRYAGAWAASRLRRHPEGPPVLSRRAPKPGCCRRAC